MHPHPQAKDKLTADSWPLRLSRTAERTLESLDADQAKFVGDMEGEQAAFAEEVQALAGVSAAVYLGEMHLLHQCLSATVTKAMIRI